MPLVELDPVERTLDLHPKPKLKEADVPARAPLRVEVVFDLVLNPEQLAHYQGVRTFVGFPKDHRLHQREIDAAREWLANSNRGQGRTLVLALCWLEYAATWPDRAHSFFDHHQTRTGHNCMRRMLQDMADRNPIFRAAIEFPGESTIRFKSRP